MTLVEMVIATVIFSLVMLALVTAFNAFGRTYNTLDAQINQISRVREVDQFLRNALRSAISGPDFLRGSGREVRWVAPVDRIGGAGGLQNLRLVVSGAQMTLMFAPFYLGEDTTLEPPWGVDVPATILLEDVSAFRISYKPFPDSSWQSQFLSEDPVDGFEGAIPWAIKLEWTSAEKEWPPLIVGLERYGMWQ